MALIQTILALALALPGMSDGFQHETGTMTSQQIPVALRYTEPFIRFLAGAGLKVTAVKRSHLEAMFDGVSDAAYVVTDRGVLEVVIFPGASDAERLSVTQRKSPQDGARHLYIVDGWVGSPSPKTIDSAYPEYFTLHRNWFIVTLEPELNALLERALGQSKTSERRQ